MAGMGKELDERICLQWLATSILLPLYRVMDVYSLHLCEKIWKIIASH